MNNHSNNIDSTQELYTLNEYNAKVIDKINEALTSQGRTEAKQSKKNGSFQQGTNYYVDKDGEIIYICIFSYVHEGEDDFNFDFLKTIKLNHIKRFVLIVDKLATVEYLSHLTSLEEIFIITNNEVHLNDLGKLKLLNTLELNSSFQSNLVPL